MGKRLAKLLLRLSGWRLNPSIPKEVQHCIIVAAPHTSNWDIYFARLGFYIMGIPLKFTIKQEWMRFPLNLLIGSVGGLPIDRRPREASLNDDHAVFQFKRNLQGFALLRLGWQG